MLAKGARAQGPAGTAAPMVATPALNSPAGPAPATKAETPRVTAQVRTMITTSGKTNAPLPGPKPDAAK